MDSRTEFIQAYITTALWSSTLDDDTPMDGDYSINDLSPKCRQEMEDSCDRFLNLHCDTIRQAIDANGVKFGPDFGPWGRAGHDFWLTRNHHGCGFWDGDWAEPFGDKLTAAAHSFCERRLYIEGEKVEIE